MPSEDALDPYRPPSSMPDETPPSPAGDAPLKDPRPLGWLAGIFIVLNVLAIVARLFQPDHLRWDDGFQAGVVVTMLLAAGAYGFWIYRCAANALVLSRDGRNHSPGWAIGSYFVPFVNWVVPCQVMLEITRKTFRHKPSAGITQVVYFWWIAFIGRSLIDRLVGDSAVMLWIWLGLNFVAMLTICYLIARISGAQAAFRWSDLPESQRPNLVPLGGRPRQISYPRPPQSAEGTPIRPTILPPRRPASSERPARETEEF